MALVPLVLACVACSPRYPLRYEYLGPTGAPVEVAGDVLQDPRQVIQAKLVAGLEETPFEVQAVDPEGAFVVARYSGAPEPYVDCGTLLVVNPQGPRMAERRSAAAASSEIWTEQGAWQRDMRLDGRLVARLLAEEEGTTVETEATYVLSKLVSDVASDAVGRQTISFSTGERATFPRGTTCQPTGAMEGVVLAALERAADLVVEVDPPEADEPAPEDIPVPPAPPPPTLRVQVPVMVEALPKLPPPEPRPAPELEALLASAVPEGSCGAIDAIRLGAGRVVLEGVASDLFAMDSMTNAIEFRYPDLTIDNRIAVLSRGACEAYQVADGRAGGLAAGARLEVLDVRAGQLQEGEALRFALGLPEGRSHVHFSLFEPDGTVSHIQLRTPVALGADAPWLVDTYQVVGAPYGREFVLAVATDEPLFDAPRPASEAASEFIPALEAALGRAADVATTACAIVTTTEVREEAAGGSAMPGNPCVSASESVAG